jgi:hypothetical protein
MASHQIQKNRIKFRIWPNGAIRINIRKRVPVKSGEMSRVIPVAPTKRFTVSNDEGVDQGET